MKRTAVYVVACVLLLFIAISLYSRWCSYPPESGKECVFEVRSGWGAKSIAEALADSALIRSELYFLWKYSGIQDSSSLQAGEYLLNDSMLPERIMMIIVRGEVIPVPTSWVTLAPGLTLEQSLTAISSSLDIDRSLLDNLAFDSSFLDELGIEALEGYLYPETYEFANTVTPPEIISKIVQTGMQKLPENTEELIGETGLSLFETIILASIVEREGMVDDEYPVIAGVFLNRLRCGKRLESCATVQYALGEVREYLTYRDTEIESPYNTYIHTGLPPGPICSPGELSISAALMPDTTNGYLYFVARGDDSGRHYFANTYSEHLANKRISSQ